MGVDPVQALGVVIVGRSSLSQIIARGTKKLREDNDVVLMEVTD